MSTGLQAATLEEALAVRAAAPHTPILIFGGLLDPEIIQAAQHGLTINVFSLQYASHVQALLQPMDLQIDVHIKVDTGMNRLGLHARPGHCAQAVSDAAQICALDRLHVTGIYTHFACADSTVPRTVRSRTRSSQPFRRSAVDWKHWASTPVCATAPAPAVCLCIRNTAARWCAPACSPSA